jgi:hypothetical protein
VKREKGNMEGVKERETEGVNIIKVHYMHAWKNHDENSIFYKINIY